MNSNKTQQVAKISTDQLTKLILREFPNDIESVTTKLEQVNSDSEAGQRRISAAILKLANRELDELDSLIEKANFDFRDIVAAAEYPRNSQHLFDERTTKEQLESEYQNDWDDYNVWLNKDK